MVACVVREGILATPTIAAASKFSLRCIIVSLDAAVAASRNAFHFIQHFSPASFSCRPKKSSLP